MKLLSMALIIFAVLVTGCHTTSRISSTSDATKVRILKTGIYGETPQTCGISWTTFGRYPLKVEKEGCEPLYAQLPLRVSGGAITCDILFFAPALFFNMQHPFPFYEFDVENKVIKYKRKENQNWINYHVPEDQQLRIKSQFEQAGV